MAVVERGNVVLEIADTEVARYLSMGFNVTDGNGTVLEHCIPNDTGVLQRAYKDHIAEIEALKTEIADLKAQLVKATEVKKTSRAKAKEE